MSLAHLRRIEAKLVSAIQSLPSESVTYRVPSLWRLATRPEVSQSYDNTDPYRFYLEAIQGILRSKPRAIPRDHGGRWTSNAVVYNSFIRTTTAIDHGGDGSLGLPVGKEGWRETGSFLKSIVMLPYLESLGVNTVHLLPITSIGTDGRKGNLGSPYAIKHPYKLDPNLAEPQLEMSAEEEFQAFVEAAHYRGIRVVVEFVFRTAAKDSDWVKEHPDWFYWIRSDIQDRPVDSEDESKYGSPVFSKEELDGILRSVEEGRHDHLIPPHDAHRSMFAPPPKPENIHFEDGRYIGTLDDGTRVRIPGAFADWPPHDTQPPWDDVTYLKLYDHPDFNYIGYNTIRMYDNRLARDEYINQPLWDAIKGIIPYYQNTFGIDGVMIDMGHALPMELKQSMIAQAREINPDFAFWDENFSLTGRSVREGYNAVIGYQWSDQHHPDRFQRMLRRFSAEGFPIAFFATPESHNTPRAAARDGGIVYSKYAWAVSNFIPAIPFIHSGFELGETVPINTGLDFTRGQLIQYPSDRLPLFSDHAYDWANPEHIVDWVRKISSLRIRYHDLIVNTDPKSFEWMETGNNNIISFVRSSGDDSKRLVVVANSNMREVQRAELTLVTKSRVLKDLLRDTRYNLHKGRLEVDLTPGQVILAEFK